VTPRVTIVAGTGGVGKTTLSAALGTALADAGKRTLVVTVDPARRLADAMAVAPSLTPVALRPDLVLWMPDARSAFDAVIDDCFPDPERFRHNPITETLRAAPAGVHEAAVAMALAAVAPTFDEVVIDTAPSHHALDFLDTPGRLARLFERRSLQFFAAFGGLSTGLSAQALIERAIGGVLPATVIADGARFFATTAEARQPLARRARLADELLGSARFLIVSGTSAASVEGASHFHDVLHERGSTAEATLMNRVPGDALRRAAARALSALDADPAAGPEWRQAIAAIDAEATRAAARRDHALRRFPNALQLPEVDAGAELIAILAERLAPVAEGVALAG